MRDEIRYITGEYRLAFDVRHVYGRIGAVLAVFKGGEFIGTLAYHPDAKQIVYSAVTASTKNTLEYIKPLLGIPSFIAIFQMLKRKARNTAEYRSKK